MNILIIKTSSLGDIIHAFPVLQYLRRLYPHARIDWVVEQPFSELVRAHPAIDHVYTVQVKKWRKNLFKRETWQEITQFRQQLKSTRYDFVLDLQGNIKSGFITGMAKSSLKVGFGYATVPEWPNLLFTHRRYNPVAHQNIRDDYLFIAQSLLGDFGQEQSGVQLKVSSQEEARVQQVLFNSALKDRLMLMICPGSNWSNKQLSRETLQEFLTYLHDQLQASFLFVWGNQEEKQLVEELAAGFSPHSLVVEKLSLPVLQNLMSHMHAVIAMDSLPLHLAGTTSVPTYSIFGASSAHKYKPIGERNHAFQGVCPFNKQFEKRCSILRTCETGACIKNINGKNLFQHFLLWWQSIYGLSSKV